MGRAKLVLAGWLVVAGSVSGCGARQDIAAASGAGQKFHDQFNQQTYAAIYQQADAKFRSAVQEDALVKLLTRVHEKLGNVTDATRTGFNVNYNFGAATVTITYSTRFQLGEGQEQFVWRNSPEGVRLLNYNIRSAALDESNTQ